MNINWFIALSSFNSFDGPSFRFRKVFKTKNRQEIIFNKWNLEYLTKCLGLLRNFI